MIADRNKDLTSVVMWSGPTPKKGITAPLVYLKDSKQLTSNPKKFKNKILLVDGPPRAVKGEAQRAAALGSG